MFDVKKTAADRVELTIAGKIDAPEMSSGVDALLATSEGMRGANMCIRLMIFTCRLGPRLVRNFTASPSFSRCCPVSTRLRSSAIRRGSEPVPKLRAQ